MITSLATTSEKSQAARPSETGAARPPVPGHAGGESPVPAATPWRTRLRENAQFIREVAMERCVPTGLENDPDATRHARLITGFGLLGFLFGWAYALFYLLIGHYYGAGIIVVCSLGVVSTPVILRVSGSFRLAGNLLTLILLLGFGGLCGIEGGIRGHAIGWLAAVPMCALLLVNGPEAAIWCAISVAVTIGFVAFDAMGMRAPVLYPVQWHEVVTAAGYIGLTLFMSLLGAIFELGRRRAFRRMECALNDVKEFNARLKKLDAEKNEFLGVAAHDLKNPLNIVMGFAEMIANGQNKSPERDREDATYIIQAADRMISLITQLLDVNAIEQGRFPIELSNFDLEVVSQQVVASYENAAAKKQISVYAAGAIMPALVRADAKASYRIIDNLLSNAIKYSPPGKDIFVRLRKTVEGVTWEVQDQGAGLTEKDKEKLFQKFTKLSARPTGGESSNGLGLSIVKMLAEAMGGGVACHSIHGEGATFSMHLPLADGVAPAGEFVTSGEAVAASAA